MIWLNELSDFKWFFHEIFNSVRIYLFPFFTVSWKRQDASKSDSSDSQRHSIICDTIVNTEYLCRISGLIRPNPPKTNIPNPSSKDCARNLPHRARRKLSAPCSVA